MTAVASLEPLVAGCRLALVGNAQSLGRLSLGADIDACDVVIRLNAAPIPDARSHGSRTDWIAASTAVPHVRLSRLGVQRLLWMSPRHRLLAAAAYGWRLPLTFYPRGWWRELAATLHARPSTGMMSIDLLCRTGGFSELQLFGFDFFQTGSLSMRKLANPPPHDFTRERGHVEALLAAGLPLRIRGGETP